MYTYLKYIHTYVLGTIVFSSNC